MFLGIILFFDGPLLALGNVLFTSGITLLIGPQKTFYFFARKQKIRGTICFFLGMLMVFCKWTILGMIVEVIGFINLFGYVLFSELVVGSIKSLTFFLCFFSQRLLPSHPKLLTSTTVHRTAAQCARCQCCKYHDSVPSSITC